MDYRVSLWNYYHYSSVPSLERVIADVKAQGYGIELWPAWQQERNLYTELYYEPVKAMLRGVRASLHSSGPQDFEGHKAEIDFAAYVGADRIVVHPDHLKVNVEKPDFALARDVLEYGRTKGVAIVLENGQLEELVRTIEAIPEFGICLDTGHVYFTSHTMKDFVDALKPRIAHLHLQDTLEESDHYILGTGIIPRTDWEYLWAALAEMRFHGPAVFEIRPRTVLRSVEESIQFLRSVGFERG